MKLMKCANGHFFDNDKYASCPYCKKDQDARTESEYATAVMDEAPSESEEVRVFALKRSVMASPV